MCIFCEKIMNIISQNFISIYSLIHIKSPLSNQYIAYRLQKITKKLQNVIIPVQDFLKLTKKTLSLIKALNRETTTFGMEM